MAESLLDRALEIRSDAVYHKRMARFHKNQARQKMKELRQFCEDNGIKFVMADESEGD